MTNREEILQYNRDAWNKQVADGNQWTVPVTSEQIAQAVAGDWNIVLTPTRTVPRDWFPDSNDSDRDTLSCDVLCLASGGGQQGPILAAAGANVTVFDNSPAQLAQDEAVAAREQLTIATVLGDMADLTCFSDNSFDLIVHPCSNCFVEDIRPVWQEVFRILRPGCDLLSGFTNPLRYLFDDDKLEAGSMEVRYKIPYSDLHSISPELKERYRKESEPLCFGHTLSDQLAGQTDVGFQLTGFFEDRYSADDVLSQFVATFIATKATKPAS